MVDLIIRLWIIISMIIGIKIFMEERRIENGRKKSGKHHATH